MKRYLTVLLLSIVVIFLSDSTFAKCRPVKTSSSKLPDPNTPNILDNKFTNVEFLGVAQVRYLNYGSKIAVERRILSLPFVQTLYVLNYPDVNSTKRPSKQLMALDWPIICISGELYLGDRHNDPNTQQQQIDAKQLRILDTLLFCAYDHETWGHEQNFTEFGRLPLLATCYQNENTMERQVTRLADIHLFAAYYNCNQLVTQEKQTSIAAVPFIHGFKFRRGLEQNSDISTEAWSSVSIPGFSCASGFKKNTYSMTAIISSYNVESMLGSPGNPIFATFIAQKSKSISNCEILRLPLIGPLWAKWNIEGKESYSGIFPNLIYHKPYQRLKEGLIKGQLKKNADQSFCN